jgi:hypothetical protein
MSSTKIFMTNNDYYIKHNVMFSTKIIMTNNYYYAGPSGRAI